MNFDASMRTPNLILASGALRKFLVARAKGAPKELLMKLCAEAMAEQEAERAKTEPRLRLVVNNNETPDLAG